MTKAWDSEFTTLNSTPREGETRGPKGFRFALLEIGAG